MRAENAATRGGPDVEAAAEQPSTFQIPPELASQYQVRVIEPSDGSERRVGMFLPKDGDIPSIAIGGNGDRIVARNEEPETIAALVMIAKHNGWEGIDVEGSLEFRKAVWTAGSREGLTVRGYDPEFGEQAKMEELRRGDAARRDHVPVAVPAPVSEQIAPKRAVEMGEATIAGKASERASELPTVREERQREAAEERRDENELLAELFLHGGAERIAAEPRLANALQAQAAMERHLGAAFDGDADRMTSANLESRHMISDVLRRGLDVSIREPTPVRQVEPIRPTHDFER